MTTNHLQGKDDERVRELIERKRAFFGKFDSARFGEANQILAGHILNFCNELEAALPKSIPAVMSDADLVDAARILVLEINAALHGPVSSIAKAIGIAKAVLAAPFLPIDGLAEGRELSERATAGEWWGHAQGPKYVQLPLADYLFARWSVNKMREILAAGKGRG